MEEQNEFDSGAKHYFWALEADVNVLLVAHRVNKAVGQ